MVSLTEQLASPVDPSGTEEADSGGRYRFRVGGQLLPVLYSLITDRPVT